MIGVRLGQGGRLENDAKGWEDPRFNRVVCRDAEMPCGLRRGFLVGTKAGRRPVV